MQREKNEASLACVAGIIACATMIRKNQGLNARVDFALARIASTCAGSALNQLAIQDLYEDGLQQTTFEKKHLPEVREAIRSACKMLGTERYLKLKRSDGHLVFVWARWKEGDVESANLRTSDLKYLTHYVENTFVDQMLLGMSQEANAHDFNFQTIRVSSDQEILDVAKQDFENGERATYLVDWSTGHATDALELQLTEYGHEVISSANSGSGIHQSNGIVGSLAAEYLVKHGLQAGDQVVVTRPVGPDGVPISSSTPTEERFHGFKSLIERNQGVVVELHVPDMRKGGIMSAVAEIVREHFSANHAKALFATSGDAGVAATLALPEWKDIPIISADMTCELIQLLFERANCLQALVGISPYYYGVFKMQRVLGNEREGSSPVKPRILDRFDLFRQESGVRSTYELVGTDFFQTKAKSTATIQSPERPVVVAILGGSASGKTTLAKIIKRRSFLNEVTVISVDAFYLDELKHKEYADFEVREAFDWAGLREVIERLRQGYLTRRPTYDFSTSSRSVSMTVYPAPILVLEGLHALDDEIAAHVDLKYFVDLSPEVRFERRRVRDLAAPERRQSDEEIQRKWSRSEEVYRAFIEPRKNSPGVVVLDGMTDLSRHADAILEKARGNPVASAEAYNLLRGNR